MLVQHFGQSLVDCAVSTNDHENIGPVAAEFLGSLA